MRRVIILALLAGCSTAANGEPKPKQQKTYAVQKTVAEWKKILDEDQYTILREAGTERAFTGRYWNHEGEGTYVCAGCRQKLFESSTKFKSGTGWPSFHTAVTKAVDENVDRSFGMVRREIVCSRCGGHLGHVFEDGPKPTGLRYCVNSASLDFVPAGGSTRPVDRD